MSSIAALLFSIAAMTAEAMPETCSQGGLCQAEGLSLIQFQQRLVKDEQDPKATDAAAAEAPANDAKAPAADANATAPAADANETAPAANANEEAPAADSNAAANATSNESTNATANGTENATTAAPPVGCATKNDPRASAWFAETSPTDTPCVFGVDDRDEGSHCIYSDGEFGSNGWCYTTVDLSTWGSCNDKCPLYGAAGKLGSKIDTVAKAITEIHSQLNASDAPEANENAAPSENASAAPAADANAAPAADANATNSDAAAKE